MATKRSFLEWVYLILIGAQLVGMFSKQLVYRPRTL